MRLDLVESHASFVTTATRGLIQRSVRHLALAVILGVAAVSAWAALSGQVSYVVTYGVSMNPVYFKGDLVFIARDGSYRVGDIAAYVDRASGQRVLHRIIGGSGSAGFVLKGDNNESVDLASPTAQQILGKAVLHVPNGGIWLKPVLSPTGLGMIGFLIVSGGATATANRRQIPRGRRKKKVKAMSRQGGSWAQAAEVVRTFERMPAPARTLAAVVAALTGLALGLALVGWMKPVTETVTAAAGASQSTTFSYSTTVPRSAAYDGTTVNSPDPVFRRLVNTVDLKAAYTGPGGTFDLTAELTNGTGWHSTVTLIPPRSFPGPTHEATAKLNLRSLSNRADAASRAIGVQAGSPVTIALRARVTSEGIAPFTSTAQLQLNEVQLSLAQGSSLSGSSDATPVTTVKPREVAVFGHKVMNAGTARSYAILVFLVAAFGAVGITFFARRSAPLRTRAEIERRHPQLLVHVEPMSSPPGKPVVNVDNFPALVKLAERYGQMILTWRRPDADDFIVRDEGITYRYRISLDQPVLENIDGINRPNSAGSHRRRASSPVP
uniref:signal peptidase I n=1 Tax=Paractinoplanes polyasparticus TaxID=2856853 RepID=UPI0027DFD498|nr:signal peptidase I [Actinoplanes polyasparticus]